MPKIKTKSGAKKRFKVTATGKIKRRHAMQSHILEKKSAKRKRDFGRDHDVRQERRERGQAAPGPLVDRERKP